MEPSIENMANVLERIASRALKGAFKFIYPDEYMPEKYAQGIRQARSHLLNGNYKLAALGIEKHWRLLSSVHQIPRERLWGFWRTLEDMIKES